jgi:hypothetical protein
MARKQNQIETVLDFVDAVFHGDASHLVLLGWAWEPPEGPLNRQIIPQLRRLGILPELTVQEKSAYRRGTRHHKPKFYRRMRSDVRCRGLFARPFAAAPRSIAAFWISVLACRIFNLAAAFASVTEIFGNPPRGSRVRECRDGVPQLLPPRFIATTMAKNFARKMFSRGGKLALSSGDWIYHDQAGLIMRDS